AASPAAAAAAALDKRAQHQHQHQHGSLQAARARMAVAAGGAGGAVAAAAALPAKPQAAVGVSKGPAGGGGSGGGSCCGEKLGGLDGDITGHGDGGGGDGGDDNGRVSEATPRPAIETGSRRPPDPAQLLLLPAGAPGVGAGPRVPPGRLPAVETAQQRGREGFPHLTMASLERFLEESLASSCSTGDDVTVRAGDDTTTKENTTANNLGKRSSTT
ncbi:unnamed protein product, partial [Ectocarpus sp. 13 AM-2016]